MWHQLQACQRDVQCSSITANMLLGGKKGTPIDWNGGGKMQRRAGWVGGVIGYLWVSKGPGLGSREALVLFNNGDASVVKGILGRSAFKEECREGVGLMQVCLFCPHARIGLNLPIYPSSIALCTIITPSFFHFLSVSPWLGSLGSVETLQVIISLKAHQKGTWLDFSSPKNSI